MFAAYWRGVQLETSVKQTPEIEMGRKPLAMSRRYDHLFVKYGRGLPISFLRALSYKESRQNPNSERDKGINLATRLIPGRKGRDSYWGLFQVGVDGVLQGYNRKHPNVRKEQLFDAATNTAIAAWQIDHQVIQAYERFAKKWGIPELNPPNRWDNAEWVKLVIAGWNSGYARWGGVQAGALYLKRKGIPVTHDNLFLHGKGIYQEKEHKLPYINRGRMFGKKERDPVTGKMGKGNKRGWQRDVIRHYYEQRGLPPTPPSIPTPGAGGAVAALAIITALTLAAVA